MLRALLTTLCFCAILTVFNDGACAVAQTADRAATKSYSAMVISQNAEVRSGPGREYYATQPIDVREEVLVFGSQSGWLAIRPPNGSFSWVRADDLRFQPKNSSTSLPTAIVRTSGLISQVGSQLTADRDVWQVELKRDEEVFVLGRDASDRDWVKIAPPAGEFRWIRETDVRRLDPSDTYLADRAANANTVQRPRETVALNTDWAGRTVAEELQEINYMLTDAVSFAASVGVLQQLADRTTEALARARDAKDRDNAEALADRIETFLSLATRQEQLSRQSITSSARPRAFRHSTQANALRDEGTNDSTVGTAIQPSTESIEKVARSVASEPRYDAMGILMPVSSGNSAAPQYALLDEEGKLQSYLTASPGMRLQAFEGHYIGVTGSRGFSPELNARHVTARQVHALDTPTRRE